MRRQPTDNKTTEKKKKSICTFITHSKCQNRSALSGRREYTEISCGVLVDLIIEWPVLSAPRNVYTMVSCGGVSTRSETENSNDKGCAWRRFQQHVKGTGTWKTVVDVLKWTTARSNFITTRCRDIVQLLSVARTRSTTRSE